MQEIKIDIQDKGKKDSVLRAGGKQISCERRTMCLEVHN